MLLLFAYGDIFGFFAPGHLVAIVRYAWTWPRGSATF
jgi:hypothetical protein